MKYAAAINAAALAQKTDVSASARVANRDDVCRRRKSLLLAWARNKIWIMVAEKAETTMQAGMKDAFILEYHGKCSQWCCFREQGKNDDWMTFKDNAAKATRFLTDPFSVEDVIGYGMAVDSANKADAKLEAARNGG